MRLITLTFLSIISLAAIGQDCTFFPSDTIVCGFKHNFQVPNETGTYSFECEDDKLISIIEISDQVSMFSFSECGTYEIIFESTEDNCKDTFRIEINDPSNSMTNIQTDISLGYGDIDCPDDVVADCFTNGVSISLPGGTPVEVWDFCTTVSCQTTTYTTSTSGTVDNCIVETISCDTTFVSDSSSECIDTNQEPFIILNSDGDMVDNNTFLAYLAQLQASVGVSCPPVFSDCMSMDTSSCYDTTVMDTSYLHIPVRLGGKWTIANIDSVELFDTTYFEFEGQLYELILDPNVEFFGPGNLDVYLYEIKVNGMDTIRDFPYGFELELQWEEDWIIDTLEFITEVPVDTTGDCFACGGNFVNSFFNVPGIPDFPCGPVSIDYPDECECEFEYPDYSLQLIECQGEKQWLVDILGGDYEIYTALGGSIQGGHNTAIISQANGYEMTLFAVDQNGCDYEIYVSLESLVEWVDISASEGFLSCEVPAIELTVEAFYQTDNGVQTEEFSSDPEWHLPSGDIEVGRSISVDEPGFYYVGYTDAYGCEYIASTEIIYDDIITTYEEYADMCGDEPVVYNGEVITEPGVYTFEIDCNENMILTVEQHDVNTLYEGYEVCFGEGVFVYDYYLFAGTHEFEVFNGGPCPDQIVVEVFEEEEITSEEIFSLCTGESIIINGSNYDSEGYFSEVFVSESGCDSILYFEIGFLEVGTIFSDNILDCVHDEALLQYTSANANELYIWRDADGNELSTDVSYIASEPGLYTLEITAIGENSVCSYMSEYELMEEKNYPEILLEEVYQFNCEPISNLDFDKEDGTSWIWYNAQLEVVAENEPLEADFPGEYTLAVTNAEGCSVERTIDIQQVDPIELSFRTESSCESTNDGSIEVNVLEGGLAPFILRVDGEVIDDIANGLDAGEHLIEVEQADGCISEHMVEVGMIPDLEEIPEQYLEFCDGKGITVTLNLGEAMTYEWLDGYESTERLFKEEGIYEVAISNQCNTVTSTYHVEDVSTDKTYTVSNVFAPNGSGANTKMKVVPHEEVSDFELYIFSRDGSLIFQTNDPHNGWDGTINGTNVLIGTYVWMIESTIITCANEVQRIQESGTVTVLY